MKWQELLENMDPLLPADFLSYSFSIPHTKLQKTDFLPDLTYLLDEEKFAFLSLSWNEEGLRGKVFVEKVLEKSFFPDYAKGDSVEIFLDTRDHKKSGFATRFCHHFVFLAEEVNGVQSEEVTRFRQEDSHPLCNSSELEVSCLVEKKSYELSFFIKESALQGYDPLQFPRIGFAYKINRFKGKPQHFPVSSSYFDLLEHPGLWASITLI